MAKAILVVFHLLIAVVCFEVQANDVVNRCPPGTYPYLDRPCDQGQAYVEVHRNHRAWLKARSDFHPLYVGLLPGYPDYYEWKCRSDLFPWIPETGCGGAWFREHSTCAGRPGISLPGMTIGQHHCVQGCEYKVTGNSESEPTGAVCLPDPCPESDTFGCGKSVAQLEQAAKPSSDPRHLFHAQQSCIANKSCKLRCEMDNCQWMDEVIPGFVDPYLGGSGRWPAVEASCGDVKNQLGSMLGAKWIVDRECFSSMGWYHVQVDLLGALQRSGCGSQRDWNLVGDQIAPCLKESQPGYPQAYYTMGGIFVHAAREAVRVQCIAKRFIQGLPIDINTDIEGKVCKAAY